MNSPFHAVAGGSSDVAGGHWGHGDFERKVPGMKKQPFKRLQRCACRLGPSAFNIPTSPKSPNDDCRRGG
jgi:hypothetical protein